jgi:hypothetical protein
MYTDLTSAVSGSAIADGMDAGLLKTVLGVLFKRKKTPKKNPFLLRASFVFNGLGQDPGDSSPGGA